MILRIVLILVSLSLLGACGGAASNSSVSNAPRPVGKPTLVGAPTATPTIQAPDTQHLINVALIGGTWKHVSTAEKPDGPRKPMNSANVTWTFNDDGTGVYKQIVSAAPDGSGDNQFKWDLQGNDIKITPSSGGETVTYTIVGRSEKEMIWQNNAIGDYYIVQKQ